MKPQLLGAAAFSPGVEEEGGGLRVYSEEEMACKRGTSAGRGPGSKEYEDGLLGGRREDWPEEKGDMANL